MYERLIARQELDFDAIVPIPLSPDKVAAGEFHRTDALAKELARLLGSRVVPLLSLSRPISKRRLLAKGYSAGQFEIAYLSALAVAAAAAKYASLLIVDDVCTHGSTVKCAIRRLQEMNAHLRITVASAGQMILKEVVPDDRVVAAA
jgi:predicted amidophosphoribosyltransferase